MCSSDLSNSLMSEFEIFRDDKYHIGTGRLTTKASQFERSLNIKPLRLLKIVVQSSKTKELKERLNHKADIKMLSPTNIYTGLKLASGDIISSSSTIKFNLKPVSVLPLVQPSTDSDISPIIDIPSMPLIKNQCVIAHYNNLHSNSHQPTYEISLSNWNHVEMNKFDNPKTEPLDDSHNKADKHKIDLKRQISSKSMNIPKSILKRPGTLTSRASRGTSRESAFINLPRKVYFDEFKQVRRFDKYCQRRRHQFTDNCLVNSYHH